MIPIIDVFLFLSPSPPHSSHSPHRNTILFISHPAFIPFDHFLHSSIRSLSPFVIPKTCCIYLAHVVLLSNRRSNKTKNPFGLFTKLSVQSSDRRL